MSHAAAAAAPLLSSSWPSHYSKTWRDYQFLLPYSQTNETCVYFAELNLTRLLSVSSFVSFASCFKFDSSFQGFLDSFLQQRKRKERDDNNTRLDVLVFAVFFRLAREGLDDQKKKKKKSSSEEEDERKKKKKKGTVLIHSNIAGVAEHAAAPPPTEKNAEEEEIEGEVRKMLTFQRLERLGALYHQPGAKRDAFVELMSRVMESSSSSKEKFKEMNEMICGMIERMEITREDRAAGVRALVEALHPQFSCLGFQTHEEAIIKLDKAYTQSSLRIARGHICALLSLIVDAACATGAFPELLSRTGAKTQRIWVDARDYIVAHVLELGAENRSLLDAFVDGNNASVVTSVRPDFSEEDGISADDDVVDKNKQQQEEENITALLEFAPQLGKRFARRLLEAVGGNVQQAVTCVFEGTMPASVASLSMSLEDNKEEPKKEPSGFYYNKKNSDDDCDDDNNDNNSHIDNDLKARILAIYGDGYEDEYDDALDGSEGRLALEPLEALVADVDGKFRDANGKLIRSSETVEEEQAPQKQNATRKHTTNQPPLAKVVTAKDPPREKAVENTNATAMTEKDRRERAHRQKEQRGSRVRSRGADRKAGFMSFPSNT